MSSSFINPYILNSGASNGNILVGNSSGGYTSTTLSSGGNINVTSGDGSITLSTNSNLNTDDVQTKTLNVIADSLSPSVTNPGHINLRALSNSNCHFHTYVNTDAVPCLSLETFSHDNLALNFDAHYSGAWLSSDAGSNYQLYKVGDVMSLRYASGVPVGNTITWNNALSVGTNGLCTIGQGLRLPTTGGTATTLNYYEEATVNTTTSGALSVAVTLYITRVGRQVTISIPAVSGTASSTNKIIYVNNVTLPSRFHPNDDIVYPVLVSEAGVVQTGSLVIADFLGIEVNKLGGNFTSGTAVAIYETSITYNIY